MGAIRVALCVTGIAVSGLFASICLVGCGSAQTGAEITIPVAVTSPALPVRAMIIRYGPGVDPVESATRATGSSALADNYLRPAVAMSNGLYVAVLGHPVASGEADEIARRLIADIRIDWAEPDRAVGADTH